MIYCSIDTETTGLDASQNQLLEMAAVLEDTSSKVCLNELPYFRAVLIEKSLEYRISTTVMRMHQKLFEEIDQIDRTHLDAHGVKYMQQGLQTSCYLYPENLQVALIEWLQRAGGFTDKGKVIAAGKNFYGFDYKFLEPHLPNINFMHRSLDPVMYYLKPTDRQPPNLELCCERAGITLEAHHTALGDALTVIQLIRFGTRD